ncbi:AIDA repeat-containing protein, partial [Commensalibacter communis]|uniref:AIDA repeat-containing protein n=1 Tax=Commensalibacter communis TaxID=2972786 RepID=UPI0022FFBFDE
MATTVRTISSGTTETGNLYSTSGDYLTNYGNANRFTLSNGAILDTRSGGRASGTIVNNDGRLYINGGVASNTTLNSGGYIATYNGGKSYDNTINLGAYEDLGFNNITKEYSPGSSYNAKIYGSQYVYSGSVTNGATVYNGGSQELKNGATASNTTINGGSQELKNGATASNTTINGGSQELKNGAT